MDIELLVAQWSGKLPPGFVRPPALRQPLPTCAQRRCKRPVWVKPDGTLATSCRPCLDRRAASCRRRRRHFVNYVSYYTSTVPFVARLDVGGRRLASGTPTCLVGGGSGISYRR